MNQNQISDLYVFAISHFSEKARFLLDYSGTEFTTKYLTPVEHIPEIKSLAPESHVPVWVNGSGTIQGSNQILQYLKDQKKLESQDWEKEMDWINKMDEELGYPLQSIVYSFLLDSEEIISVLFSKERGKPAKFENFPFIQLGLKRRYKLKPDNIKVQKELFARGIQRLDAAYSERDFLVGSGLGGADITAASLVSPLLLPEEHPNYTWFSGIRFPDPLLDWISGWSGGPFGQRAREIYRQFR
jgi:glutathione S-transferase